MALVSPHITASAVAAVEYPDLVRQYRVTGVPKTVVNDRIEIMGAAPEASFISQVLESVA
jgi:predicted DsbA family dithiol-disulfide isomerase